MNYKTHHWGYEYIWADTGEYSSRMLIITNGNKMPYIYNREREKTILVVQGVVHLIIEGRNKILNEKDTYTIRPKVMHQLIALKGDVTIWEVGTQIKDDDEVIINEK